MSSERMPPGGAQKDAETRKRLKAVEAAIKDVDALLIGWLTKKFADNSTARDIAQDAYLRVWRFAHDAAIDDPRALIFKAAANLAANEFKAQRRFRANHIEPSILDPDDRMAAVPADAPSPERAECARQDWEICRKAIAALPDKARRAFILSRFEELTYREIAEKLGVSESSVEKYIILALKCLRSSTAEQEKPSGIVNFAERVRRKTFREKAKIRVR